MGETMGRRNGAREKHNYLCSTRCNFAGTLISNDSIDTNTNGRYAQVLALSVIRLGFERLDFWAPVVRTTAMNGGRVSYKKRVVVIAGSSL